MVIITLLGFHRLTDRPQLNLSRENFYEIDCLQVLCGLGGAWRLGEKLILVSRQDAKRRKVRQDESLPATPTGSAVAVEDPLLIAPGD